MYTIDGLQRGIENARKNIATLKQAIAREKTTISDYERMIGAIEKKEALQKDINIEVVRED